MQGPQKYFLSSKNVLILKMNDITWMDKHDIADLDLDIWLRAIGG